MAAYSNYRDQGLTTLGNGAPLIQPGLLGWDAAYDIKSYKEGEFIFREGEEPLGLYFLKSGVVKLYVNREFTRGRISSPEFINKLVGPGEFFGFKSIIKGAPQSIFAKTLKPCELYVFQKSVLTQVMNGPNSLLKSLFQQVIRDLETHEANAQLHYLASVQERIAYQLAVLAEKFGMQSPQGIHLNLKLTRNELAQLAGTINESLSRHLTELKSEGVIDLNGREIIVKNLELLKAKSGNFRRA